MVGLLALPARLLSRGVDTLQRDQPFQIGVHRLNKAPALTHRGPRGILRLQTQNFSLQIRWRTERRAGESALPSVI